jgi:hypothetical protein
MHQENPTQAIVFAVRRLGRWLTAEAPPHSPRHAAKDGPAEVRQKNG